jgi:hypothetical protein
LALERTFGDRLSRSPVKKTRTRTTTRTTTIFRNDGTRARKVAVRGDRPAKAVSRKLERSFLAIVLVLVVVLVL